MYRALLLGAGICVILVIAWSVGVAQPFMYRPISGPSTIFPLPPQESADIHKWEALDKAAGAAKLNGNWAEAAADYRAEALLRYSLDKSDAWVELGLMRDYQGKRAEAFLAYQKGFGIGSHRGPCVGGGPEIAEAAARCGQLCEDRGLHADACECYYTARRSMNRETALPMTLDADHTSSAATRRLLAFLVRDAQVQDQYTRGPI